MSSVPDFKIGDIVEIKDYQMHAIVRLMTYDNSKKLNLVKVLHEFTGKSDWDFDLLYYINDVDIIKKLDDRAIKILFDDEKQ